MKLSKESLFLAEIYNYSCKGIVAGLGKGEGITKKAILLTYHVKTETTYANLADYITSTNMINDGDIVAMPSKVISILEKRFVYGLTIENYKKCISDFSYVNKVLKVEGGEAITRKDQIGLDKIDPVKKIGVIYPKNPNRSAAEIAQAIKNKSGFNVDVVITDSDSGAIKGMELIGCPTIINTPIASTKGLGLFYAMRVAVAAEINWNNKDFSPIFLVKPYQASSVRPNIGKLKYDGFLDADKEDDYLKFT